MPLFLVDLNKKVSLQETFLDLNSYKQSDRVVLHQQILLELLLSREVSQRYHNVSYSYVSCCWDVLTLTFGCSHLRILYFRHYFPLNK